VKEKKPIAELDSVSKLIADVEAKLGGNGRVMVRYSGTEPKARVLVEGPDAGQVDAWANEIADTMRSILN
jgi:phosphoglucosamine mutase